jgi:hypothetical protein
MALSETERQQTPWDELFQSGADANFWADGKAIPVSRDEGDRAE